MADVSFPGLPPEEAIKFFKKKGYAVGFNWKDIWQEEHAAAFTVAKAMQVDILEDIRGELESAFENGTTFETFKKNITPTLQKKGWWGVKKMTDPLTGKTVKAQLGSPRRLRIIYDTNMRTAHAAGRWERIERRAESFPYLRYSAVLDGKTRPQHRSRHGTILPVNHPFWDTHYPPNGWRCRCIVQQISDSDLERRGWEVSTEPKINNRDWLDKRSGQILKVPEGIDPGFAYNVGKTRFKAYVPPPAGGLPSTVNPLYNPVLATLPEMPKPTKASDDMLLPAGLRDEEYMRAFLKEFDADIGKPAIWKDPTGETLIISEALFTDASGKIKVKKQKRERYTAMLAKSLKEPDEIWQQWEKSTDNKKWFLRRRYLKRWKTTDGSHALTVFDWHKREWSGVTTFQPKHERSLKVKEEYFQKQRGGLLVWRKK